METQFTPDQLVIISMVASVILFAVNEIADANGVTLGRAKLTAGLYVISFILAVIFTPQVFPPLPVLEGDPAAVSASVLGYLGVLLTQLSLLAGIATAIYNIIGQKVLNALATRMLKG